MNKKVKVKKINVSKFWKIKTDFYQNMFYLTCRGSISIARCITCISITPHFKSMFKNVMQTLNLCYQGTVKPSRNCVWVVGDITLKIGLQTRF